MNFETEANQIVEDAERKYLSQTFRTHAWRKLEDELNRLQEGEDHEEADVESRALARLVETSTDLQYKLRYIYCTIARLFQWDGTGDPKLYLDEEAPGWDANWDMNNPEHINVLYQLIREQEDDSKGL